MELKNSVVVDLNIYNELRDFKRAVEEDKICVSFRNTFGGNPSYYYISYEEAVIELTKINESNEKIYSEKISELVEEINNLKINPPIQLTIEDIKKLSLIKLIKWYFKK